MSAATRAFLLSALPLLLGASAPATGSRQWATPAPDATSRRLCDALQALSERRKAECCVGSPSAGIATECVRELSRSVRDNAITVDPADGERCAADFARALEGCDWVTPYLPPPPPSCRGILHGRLAAGAACRSSLECHDGLHCAAGVCASPRTPGASCTGAPDTLTMLTRQTDDSRHPECTGYCFRGRCAAPVPTGGACSADQQCAAGSHCASGHCIDGPRPKLGEPCDGSTCADGLVCIAGRCAQPKQLGESCTQPAECRATCVGATPDRPGACATKCSVWPPAGYTPPVANAAP